MGRNKKTYSEEFRKKCIQELMNGKAFSSVCTDNNVAPSTLSDWKKAAIEGKGPKDREYKLLERKYQETEEKLRNATELLGKKELEIELLKKDLRF